MTVKVRFAPSPTGFLHIGSARTALFNWLYAKNKGGVFSLRIEDTDRERSTPEAIDAILKSMEWLGLTWDGEAIYQFEQRARHAEVALEMLAKGKAYYCYASPEELTQMREEQKAKHLPQRYDGRWRDRDPSEAPQDRKPVVRLKALQEGETILQDLVQGEVRVKNTQLDDMVLLRADGTPTYMLSVVVDDHDMDITHVIRGDDHLTNTFRQIQIYQAMGWEIPQFGHIPLIFGEDGTKLSKRHGAIGVEAYQKMGYLPEALKNYLVRLGWSHGDDEIMSIDQAIGWFNLESIGRAPSRFDFTKLNSMNAHYLKLMENKVLAQLVIPFMRGEVKNVSLIEKAIESLKQRAKTLVELAEQAAFYVAARPIQISEDMQVLLTIDALKILKDFEMALAEVGHWDHAELDACVKSFLASQGIKMPQLGQPLRIALSGSTHTPALVEVLTLLGENEVKGRIKDVLSHYV